MSTKEELLKLRDEINQQLAELSNDSIAFSVDANIINRLGKELIGRAETGVSELIKNTYDADATFVSVDFVNSNLTGGTLIIDDDGHGMTKESLIKGFMTLSSTSKIHEPISPKFKRQRAGRKGIGRFATQFLGEKLIIITQVESEEFATKVTIDWNSYEMDKELSSIENHIEAIPKQKIKGTTLYIEQLRHSWTDAQIRRVFRYISDLLQPTFLSDRSSELNIAKQGDESFLVECYRTENGLRTIIADINKLLYEKCLAEIDGYVTKEGDAYVQVKSTSLQLNDADLAISSSKASNDIVQPYLILRNVNFKVYYFIYDRPEYYKNGITKQELGRVENLASEQSGIRVYRNGFRVLPYGEVGDDWLKLDRQSNRMQFELNESTVSFNIPYTNKNFFGFVELIDKEGDLFEETASREGLIENKALEELRDFVRKAVTAGVRRIAPFIYNEKQKRDQKKTEAKTLKAKVEGLQAKIEEFTSEDEQGEDDDETDFDSQNNQKAKDKKKEEIKGLLSELNSDLKVILDEIAMLRILATLGITIGEFTHEIVQFPIFFNSKLQSLLITETDPQKRESLEQVVDKVNHLDTYTSYFNDAVSRNSKRELEFIELRRVIRPFLASTKWDFEHEGINVEEDIRGYDVFTVQMHPSEWHSILLNLYTNSKKALRRAKPSEKKIKIVAGKDDQNVYLEFLDNGDGIPKENENRIFDAFFTTSSPAGMNASLNEQLIGSGLGLKILKDIIAEYKGDIFVASPSDGFNTCIRIEIPKATDEQIRTLQN
ncbi:sensor histidine kinase [Sediminibacterium goheungense]|uniref:histidine kinase n=1 Tax=Sediminibacterium goheungense TaxID=1086393 RepID=A0A4R6J1V1_9BACT|nr:sensor histidine kinase [Sediminibacterium goheungense]TDO29224.1 signal transduction histidine kinase [Sediminibacterium goheungense]